MSDTNSKKRQVHLVGSVPLNNAEEVFHTTSSILGDCLPRIPDGETGNRLQWIMYQYILMSGMSEFEVVGGMVSNQQLRDEIESYIANSESGFDMSQRQLQVRDGVDPVEIQFPILGYAGEAEKSYEKFRTLRDQGAVHKDSRFQVSLPTPLAPIQTFISPKGLSAAMPLYQQYKKAMSSELENLTKAIPANDLAIQWDVCIEVVMLENRQNDQNVESWRSAIGDELISLAEIVPEPVQLGFHFCYGDIDHKHFFEPNDTALMTELANTISSGVRRSIQWIHMPVPRDRRDIEYFQPLSDLRIKKETQLFLGLVHITDGLDGTIDRMKTAQRCVAEFGIATECGLGRRSPESIPGLLELHLRAATSAQSQK